MRPFLRRGVTWLAAGLGLAAATYAGYVGLTWYRYGDAARPRPEEEDALLDRFMPEYEVVERHHIHVGAPAEVTLASAREVDLQGSGVIRSIIKARETILGATPDDRQRPRGLLAETQSLGWGVLADVPGREIVVGAVTRPWDADVKFIALPADRFAAFAEPSFIKIVWTLRADPVGSATSVFRTETRAVATDAFARAKFRRYWSLVSLGIWLIRRMSLGPLKSEAERRAGGVAGTREAELKSWTNS